MDCPACLLFQVETPATTVVEGTQYCAQHGTEALKRSIVLSAAGRRSNAVGANGVTPFTPPAAPPA